jgi:hypothetical protein
MGCGGWTPYSGICPRCHDIMSEHKRNNVFFQKIYGIWELKLKTKCLTTQN